jgi:hypothetical protein
MHRSLNDFACLQSRFIAMQIFLAVQKPMLECRVEARTFLARDTENDPRVLTDYRDSAPTT